MLRRTFFAAIPAAVIAPTAWAQTPSRGETLLLVQEYGPNSLDMQGIGSSPPGSGIHLTALTGCCGSSGCRCPAA